MKCHWTTHEGQRVFMPGCEQGWHNSAHCICRWPRAPKVPTEQERLIKELEAENARLNRIIRRLTKSK